MNKKNKTARVDLEIIASLIKSQSKVLDIGCGDGELLELLKITKQVNGRGLEISQTDASKTISKGISVIQGDANTDLPNYPDNSFDYAILSQTIQAMKNPQEIIEQMLRIANFAIISLPNFAYFKNRLYLLFKGEMPVRKTIPYQWYDTPNIHFCSIDDFENLCNDMGFSIKQKFYLNHGGGWIRSKIFANFFAEFGIFMITKDDKAFNTESEFIFKKSKNLLLGKATVGLANKAKLT